MTNPAPTYRQMVSDPEHLREVEARWDSMQGWVKDRKTCATCGGDGFVLEDDQEYTCPDCGGFSP